MKTDSLIHLYVQCDMGLDRLRKHDAGKYDELVNEIHDMQHQIRVVFNDDATLLNDLASKKLTRIGTVVLDNYDIMKPRFSLDSIQKLIGIVRFTNHPEEYLPIIRILLKPDMQAYEYASIMGFIEKMMSRN